MAEHILFYGKGGVGKSTLVANISAAFAETNFKILQIGCDLKGDSCSTLNDGFPIPTIFDSLSGSEQIKFEDCVHYGFRGVATMEIGTPHSNYYAGNIDKEIERVFALLQKEQIFEKVQADYILYDISGEKNFEAFYSVLSRLGAHRVFVITSADFMSLSTVNHVIGLMAQRSDRESIPFGGMIPNGLINSFEDSFIADYAKHAGIHIMGRVPRSLIVRQCELYGKTVIEASPLSNQSYYYRRLANQIIDNTLALSIKTAPCAMSSDSLRKWAHEWAVRLDALENGLVNDGAAI